MPGFDFDFLLRNNWELTGNRRQQQQHITVMAWPAAPASAQRCHRSIDPSIGLGLVPVPEKQTASSSRARTYLISSHRLTVHVYIYIYLSLCPAAPARRLACLAWLGLEQCSPRGFPCLTSLQLQLCNKCITETLSLPLSMLSQLRISLLPATC